MVLAIRGVPYRSMIPSTNDGLDPALLPPIRWPWLAAVRNLLRFYATFVVLIVLLLAVVGLLSDTSGMVTLVGLVPLAILMLPGVAVAASIAYILPLRRSRTARLIAVIDFAACAYLGTALGAAVLGAVSGIYGIWSAPILVATVAGVFSGLIAEPRPAIR
jgi:hypothetical protein